jgi:hypothetical protein
MRCSGFTAEVLMTPRPSGPVSIRMPAFGLEGVVGRPQDVAVEAGGGAVAPD